MEEASQIATVTSIVERIKGLKGLDNRVTAESSGKMPAEKAMSTPSAKVPAEKTMSTPPVGMKKEASQHEASSRGSGCG